MDKGHHSTLHTHKINSIIWNLDLGKKKLWHPRTKSKSNRSRNIIGFLTPINSVAKTVKFKTLQPS